MIEVTVTFSHTFDIDMDEWEALAEDERRELAELTVESSTSNVDAILI